MSEQTKINTTPEVLLLVGTHCVHCKSVLNSCAEFVKDGVIASLEVVNLERCPDMAENMGVRSVPWIKIGLFELEGARSKAELLQWVKKSDTREGMKDYLSEILSQGQVQKALAIIRKQENVIEPVLELLANADEKINTKLGVGVIMEEYAPMDFFQKYIPQLSEFTKHEDARVRGDACHYLSLTNNANAVPHIEALLQDLNSDVREAAEESLQELREQL